MAEGFNRQIHELSVRTLAYHSRCQDLWTKAPPPPHYGAPFLFSYVWAGWTPAQRRTLVEQGRQAVQQSVAQMMGAATSATDGSNNAAAAKKESHDAAKMQLLLAACVPEIFQDELHTQLRPMAHLLGALWGRPSKSERQAARASRPKHISSQMAFIDQLPFVWSSAPTLKLMEHTLAALDYKVFDTTTPSLGSNGDAKLSPEDNEMFQRDLLLSLRAFWMSYFGLQIFMSLSDHFHTTEERLLREARAQEQKDAAAAAYAKPIHVMKIDEILMTPNSSEQGATVEEVEEDQPTASTSAAAATSAASSDAAVPPASSSSSSTAAAADPSILPSVPASLYCACCHQSPMVAVLSATSDPKLPSSSASSSSAPSSSGHRPPLELKRCARCKSVYYCSQTCQKKHFKAHKNVCIASAAATAAATAVATTPTTTQAASDAPAEPAAPSDSMSVD